jgi:hypothetical protein
MSGMARIGKIVVVGALMVGVTLVIVISAMLAGINIATLQVPFLYITLFAFASLVIPKSWGGWKKAPLLIAVFLGILYANAAYINAYYPDALATVRFIHTTYDELEVTRAGQATTKVREIFDKKAGFTDAEVTAVTRTTARAAGRRLRDRRHDDALARDEVYVPQTSFVFGGLPHPQNWIEANAPLEIYGV